MITIRKNYLIALVAAVLVWIPVLSEASNGFFAHGYGARNKAMAGATTALPQDALAAAINPAGMVYMDNRLDMEVGLFKASQQYTVEGVPTFTPGSFPLNPGTTQSDDDWIPIPTFGWNHKLDSQQSIGISIYPNGGVITDYAAKPNPLCGPGGKGTFCAGTAGIDLEQGFFVPSYAHSFNNGKFSLGIAPIFAVQRLSVQGLNAFARFSGDPGHFSNKGFEYSLGGGVRIGVLAEPIPGLRFGASYKSRIFMSRFSDYSGLLAEHGSFDIPESYNFGLSWDINNQFTTTFDIEHIRYSQIHSLGNPFLPNLLITPLGNKNGSGSGLRDMTIFKFGAQWRQDDSWIWRAGISYGEQPIPNSEVLLNILTPGVQEIHLTTGFSYAMDKDDEFSFSFTYSPPNSIKGQNPLSPGQSIELEIEQLSLQLAWSRRF